MNVQTAFGIMIAVIGFVGMAAGVFIGLLLGLVL